MSQIAKFNDTNLSTTQKLQNFGLDAGYYTAKGVGSYWAGSMVAAGTINIGSAAMVTAYDLGATFGGAVLIGVGVAIAIGVGGALLIYYGGKWLDNKFKKFKNWLF